MRFLFGIAEAGLFPGMILFFTCWFPDWRRARIVSGFSFHRWPQLAHWLRDEERTWLTATLETERRRVEAKRKISPWESLRHPKVLWLALNYFCVVTESVGMLLILPNSSKVGWVTMIRDICALR